MEPKEKRLNSISRRRFLSYSSFALFPIKLQSNQQAFIPNLTPRLQDVWLSIKRSGDAEFIAVFESDPFNWIRHIPGSDLSREGIDRRGGNRVTIEPVSLDRAQSIDQNRKITGTISDFASKTERGDETVFEINNSITISKEQINDKVPVISPADDLVPKGSGFLNISFPDGYSYTLPDDYQFMKNRIRVFDDIDFFENELPYREPPIEYNGQNKKLTVPSITHLNNTDLTWLKAVSELKSNMFSNGLVQLYRQEYYAKKSIEAGVQVARDTAQAITKEAASSLFTSKMPTSVDLTLTARDISDAIKPDFIEYCEEESGGGFFGGLFGDSGSEVNCEVPSSWQRTTSMITGNEFLWMDEAQPEHDGQFVKNQGLRSLEVTTSFERALNLLYTSTEDGSDRQTIKQIYVNTIEKEQQISRNTRSGILNQPSGRPNNEYWKELYNTALSICEQYEKLTTEQLKVLDNI